MTITNGDLAGVATRRSSTWWLLSRLVSEVPTKEWLAELEAVLQGVDSDSSIPLAVESVALLTALGEAKACADGLTTLAVDRTRLLGGVFQSDALPAPYESAALGQPMNSDRVLGLVETYHEGGFDDPAPELGPPDHLGTELRFMALLCYREAQAHASDEPNAAGAWRARQQRFLDDHVLAWVPEHCGKMADQARTPFYAALARLVGRACRLDRDDLAAMSVQARGGAVSSGALEPAL